MFSLFSLKFESRVNSVSDGEKSIVSWEECEKNALTYEINRLYMYCISKWPKRKNQAIKWENCLTWDIEKEDIFYDWMLLVYWSYVYGHYVRVRNIFFIFIRCNTKYVHQNWFNILGTPFFVSGFIFSIQNG